MTNAHEIPKQPRTAKRGPLPWVIGFALLVLCTVAYSLVTGSRLAERHAPQMGAATKIGLEAAIGHLWLEEVINGDRNEDIAAVWEHLDQSVWYAEAMLEGGENAEGPVVPVRDLELRREIEEVLANLGDFRAVAEERWVAATVSGIGSDIDQRFDVMFDNLLNQADDVETALKGALGRDLRRFRVLQGLLIVFCLGSAVLVGIIIRRYERRQALTTATLRESEQNISDADKWVARRRYALRPSRKAHLRVRKRGEPGGYAGEPVHRQIPPGTRLSSRCLPVLGGENRQGCRRRRAPRDGVHI